MTIHNDIDAQINEFVKVVQATVEAGYADSPNANPEITTTKGRRYNKIITRTWGQSSVFCFVDRTNGDVLKAESWKKPARHARSNIFSQDVGASGITQYGAQYM